MLVLNPREVTFDGEAWPDVAAVMVDRSAARLVEEWGDRGPFAAFGDVPEVRVAIRVVQELARDELGGPSLGQIGELVLFTSPAWSEGGRRKVAVRAMVTRVEHEVSLKRGAIRTVTMAAISEDGAEDPVTLSDGGA